MVLVGMLSPGSPLILLDVHTTQYVGTAAFRSVSLAVLFGVPQCSVLRPILFLLYVADLLQLVSDMVSIHTAMQTTLGSTGFLPCRMLTHCNRVCRSALTKSSPEWYPTCNLILPRPTCCGVHPIDVSIRSRLVLLVSVTHLCFWYEQFETWGLHCVLGLAGFLSYHRTSSSYIDADVTMSAHLTAIVKAC